MQRCFNAMIFDRECGVSKETLRVLEDQWVRIKVLRHRNKARQNASLFSTGTFNRKVCVHVYVDSAHYAWIGCSSLDEAGPI